jgi:type IV pilus assembly protein PilE
MKNLKRGFTLIELMIVVAIVGILAAVAVPSYTTSVQKSRRADARASLQQLVQFMERNNTVANRYDLDGAGNAIALPFTQSPTNGTPKYYNLSPQGVVTPTAFILQAVPIAGGAQAGDTCGTLSITNTGVKSPTTAGCW